MVNCPPRFRLVFWEQDSPILPLAAIEQSTAGNISREVVHDSMRNYSGDWRIAELVHLGRGLLWGHLGRCDFDRCVIVLFI